MGKKLTTNEFIEKSKRIHGKKYDYSLVDYKGCQDKVIIICKIHGKFLQTPNSHLNKRGCPKCADEYTSKLFLKNENQVINEFIKIHQNKYNYSNFKYKGTIYKSEIICPTHGIFLQSASCHLQGKGCPKCIGRNKTNKEIINEFNLIHNNKYDYSKFIYIDCKTKGKIICPIHGCFYQTPSVHLRGCGCLKCSITTKIQCQPKEKEKFLIESRNIHKNIYDYSKFIYINNHTKSIIICPIHGEFLQDANHHLRGYGCLKCGGCEKSNKEEFVKKCKSIYGNLYDYSKFIYITAKISGEIICKKHGKFFQTPNNHLRGTNCPKCKKQVSRPETEFLDYLKIPNTKENRQVHILRKKVDGYDPKTNTIYEFLGDYWHGNPEKFPSNNIHPIVKISYGKLYNKTFDKFKMLKENGYNIKYIWESDWKLWNKNRLGNIPIKY